jgi:predicted Rossmann fold flavoprotein
MPEKLTIAVVGGGAAGFFGAIACAQANPDCRVILIEKARQVLSKVRISGGGRCNVTHACFEPSQLIQNYPRGGKELRGAFSRFQPRDTVQWFESRGVQLKVEEDGRIFPITDNSETIIDCLMRQLRTSGAELWTEKGVLSCIKTLSGFTLGLSGGQTLECQRLLIASGGTAKTYQLIQNLGHTIVPSVPSLFTFNIPDSPLHELAGVSVGNVKLSIEKTPLKQSGPLLITHWGFSGPAVLKLSAWGARLLHDMEYMAVLHEDWLPEFTEEALKQLLTTYRSQHPARQVSTESPFPLPKNLWKALLDIAQVLHETRWSAFSKAHLNQLVKVLHDGTFQIKGKSTYKEEFVTCGGVKLQEVNFKTMESRFYPGLYFAGEVLDIDGVTGGFNFQNAWTTSWLAAQAMSAPLLT